jgi:hypothetical protein
VRPYSTKQIGNIVVSESGKGAQYKRGDGKKKKERAIGGVGRRNCECGRSRSCQGAEKNNRDKRLAMRPPVIKSKTFYWRSD